MCTRKNFFDVFVENLDKFRHKYSPVLYLAFITKLFEIPLRNYMAKDILGKQFMLTAAQSL